MKIKPEKMEELAAATSLIRPGTAGLDDYVAGKYKKTIMKKIDSRLSKWLESTYGAKYLVPKHGNCWKIA